VVLLLGPLPGIIAGAVLGVYLRLHPSPHLRSVAVSLVWINAFNLLPIAPLDGGQFFRVLIFSRHRYLELAFGFLAGLLCLAGLALGSFVLPIIGLGMLLGLPRQARLLRAAKELAGKYPDLPADPAALDDAQSRELFTASRKMTLHALRRSPREGAMAMEQVLERTVSRSPSILASLALLVPWAVGLVAALFGAVMLAQTSAPDWQVQAVPQGGLSIKLPHRALTAKIHRPTPFGDKEMLSLDATGTSGVFYLRWYDLPAGAVDDDEKLRAFLDRSRDLILARADGRLIEEGPLPDGRPGRAFRMSSKSYGIDLIRIVLVGSRVFMLYAPAEPAEEAKMFFDSFVLTSAGAGPPPAQPH
jgi:hypothetical protein